MASNNLQMPLQATSRAKNFLKAGLVTLFAICSSQAEQPQRLKVGFIGVLSGPASVYGIANRRGVELALADLGEHAGIEVFYEDDQFDSRKSVDALRKLIDVEHVDAIITLGSSPSNATAPLANQRKIPMITWASDPKVSKNRSYVLRSCPSGQTDGVTVAREAKRRGIKNVVGFINNNEYSTSILEGFRSDFPKTVSMEDQLFESSVQDFRSVLSRASSLSIDGIFLCLGHGQLGLIAKQLRQLGVKAPLFGCVTFNDREEFQVAPQALTGAWYVNTHVSKDFETRYLNQFGDRSGLAGAAIQYEVVRRLNDSAKNGARGDDLISAILAQTKSYGPIGEASFVKTADDQYLDVPRIIEQLDATGNRL